MRKSIKTLIAVLLILMLPIFLLLAAAALLGAAFGVAPALHAAGMQPVDALRCE